MRTNLILSTVTLVLLFGVALAATTVFASKDGETKQAKKELAVEMAEKKLDAMVEKGILTKNQATEKLQALSSRDGAVVSQKKPAFKRKHNVQGKKPVFKRKHNVQGKNQGGLGKGPVDEQIIRNMLNKMVEKGLLTHEQARKKLQSLKR